MLKEFKKFALKGNMIDLAVGVIIGGGFNALVTSMVNDIIMPVISLFTGRLDFTNMFIALDGGSAGTYFHDRLRQLHHRADQFPVNRVCHLPGHPLDEQAARQGRTSAAAEDDQGLSFLQDRDRSARHPLPALHFPAGSGINKLGRKLSFEESFSFFLQFFKFNFRQIDLWYSKRIESQKEGG